MTEDHGVDAHGNPRDVYRFDVLMGYQELELSKCYASSNPDGFPDVLYDPAVPPGEFHFRNKAGVVTLRGYYGKPAPRSSLNRVRDFFSRMIE